MVRSGMMNTQIFRFGHDRVQQAAHSLFETQLDREIVHFRSGKALIKTRRRNKNPPTNVASQQFLATNQLNLGASTVCDQETKLELM